MAPTKYRKDKKTNDFLYGVFEELVEHKEDPIKDVGYRSSAFPYCPIVDMENMQSGLEGFEPSYNSEFYTGSGTAHHENLQKWIPLMRKHGVHVWGDWACTNYKCPDWNKTFDETGDVNYKNMGRIVFAKPAVKKDGKLSFKTGLKPTKCKSCGATHFKYLEVTFAEEFGVSGHVDMIFYIGGKIVIIDFKTTQDKRFDGEWEKYLPSHSNVCQISNYCVMFERKYKVRPYSWSLIYLSRDRPDLGFYAKAKGPKVLPISHRWKSSDVEKWGARLDKAKTGRAYVERLLKSKSKAKTEKIATKLVQQRPCREPLEYEDWMKAKFFGKNECPHFASGKCAAKKAAPEIMVQRATHLKKQILITYNGLPPSVARKVEVEYNEESPHHPVTLDP